MGYKGICHYRMCFIKGVYPLLGYHSFPCQDCVLDVIVRQGTKILSAKIRVRYRELLTCVSMPVISILLIFACSFFSHQSFHSFQPRTMSFKKMDPSCTIGFYCETKAEFEKFRQQTTEVSSVNKHYYPKQDTAFFIKNILQHHQFVESLAELFEPIWIPSPVVTLAVIRATTSPQFMEQFCSLIKTKSPLCHYFFYHFHQVSNFPVPHHNALISLYIDM